MDVVVPHTRTMADLLEVLDVIVADDPETRGDFWRAQPWVPIPAASAVRPAVVPGAGARMPPRPRLARQAIRRPAMYSTARSRMPEPGRGIGGPTGQRIEHPRLGARALGGGARATSRRPAPRSSSSTSRSCRNYEADRAGAPSIIDRGIVPPSTFDREIWDLSMWSWHDFLARERRPGAARRSPRSTAPRIFPHPEGALPDRYDDFDIDIAEYVTRARAHRHHRPVRRTSPSSIRAGFEGLEETRRIDLEEWMDELGLDAVVFPAVADVGPADMDVNEASADLGWRNGVWVANGNLVPRHLGIPTVTVPMGTMADIGMPVGLTFAGRAYDDTDLLALAAAFEAPGSRRTAPPRTPPLRP